MPPMVTRLISGPNGGPTDAPTEAPTARLQMIKPMD